MSKAETNKKLKIEKMTSEKKRQAVRSMEDIREKHETKKMKRALLKSSAILERSYDCFRRFGNRETGNALNL